MSLEKISLSCRRCYIDATSITWTGSHTFLSDFIDSFPPSSAFEFILIIHSGQEVYINHTVSSCFRIVIIEHQVPLVFPTKLARKSIFFCLLGLESFFSGRGNIDLLIVNTSAILLPFSLSCVKIWHNSIHLRPDLYEKLLLTMPCRWLRFKIEMFLDHVTVPYYRRHCFPSHYIFNLVSRIHSSIIDSTVVPHSLSYLASISPHYPKYRTLFCSSNHSISLLYVAALESYKNHHIILDALDQLNASGYVVNLVLVGPIVSPSVLNYVESSSSFLSGRVKVLGRIPKTQVFELMQKSSFSLAFSDSETFGYTIPESLRFCLPVIALDRESNLQFGLDSVITVSSSDDFYELLLQFLDMRLNYAAYSLAAYESYLRLINSYPASIPTVLRYIQNL